DERAERLDAVDHAVLGNRLAVDADALAKRDQMRRGVETDLVAVGFQDRGEHRRHRALAVGTTDLDQPIALLGPAQRVQQALDPLEPWAHPRVLAAPERLEPGDGLGVRHERVTAIGAARRRRRRGRGGGFPSDRAARRSYRAVRARAGTRSAGTLPG